LFLISTYYLFQDFNLIILIIIIVILFLSDQMPTLTKKGLGCYLLGHLGELSLANFGNVYNSKKENSASYLLGHLGEISFANFGNVHRRKKSQQEEFAATWTRLTLKHQHEQNKIHLIKLFPTPKDLTLFVFCVSYSPQTISCDPHLNRLAETVQMSDHSIYMI
jgi:hypothetical protein